MITGLNILESYCSVKQAILFAIKTDFQIVVARGTDGYITAVLCNAVNGEKKRCDK